MTRTPKTRQHDHDHTHHHGHDHGGTGTSRTRLGWVALITGIFLVVEVAGGVLSGSLALLADAGHMLTDFAALIMAYVAARLAQRPADRVLTFGFDRVSVLVAFVNGLSLFVIAGLILWEAAWRFGSPPDILATPMLVVAIGGLAVNLIALRILGSHGHGNLNERAAALHVLGDVLGSVAAIAAALIIQFTGWTLADPLLSVLVAVLILRNAYFVVIESGRILLEAAPKSLNSADIEADLLANVPGLAGVHHLHVWAFTEQRLILTLHARTSDAAIAPETLSAAIKQRLNARWHIDHATIEVERDHCADGDDAPGLSVPHLHA